MTSVQIKNVPEDVHRVLRGRAAEAGQSLQEFLLGRLTEEARTPTLDDVLRRAAGRAGGRVPRDRSSAAVRDDREGR